LLFPTKQSRVSRRLLRQDQERLAATSLNRIVTSASSNSITDYRSDMVSSYLLHKDSILPVKVVNVLGVVNEGLAIKHVESKVGIISDRVLTEAASAEGFAFLAFDLACGKCVQGIH